MKISKIRKTITLAVPVVLATMIGANSAQAFYDDVSKLTDRSIAGDSFNANLAREYRTLAIYESQQMSDWTDAGKHAAKGNLAADGKTPMPYDPAEWKIKGQAEMNELQDARGQLITSLDGGARTTVPSLAASAQASYDCWVEQQEEGHQPTHIAACKNKFWQAMADVNAAMVPQKVSFVPEAPAITSVPREIAREVVYFEFDEAGVRPQELDKIRLFLARMKSFEGASLALVGHTDTSGSVDYNQTLSTGRAKAVTDELITAGMRLTDLSDMSIDAVGESQPIVITGDGVREPRNRRVEIVAFGLVELKQAVSTQKSL